MHSFIRRLVIGGAGVLLIAGGAVATAPATTVHAAGTTAANCVLSGTASLPNGLNATPGDEPFTYSGSATCTGQLGGHLLTATVGAINGSGHCNPGSLATCVPAAVAGCSSPNNLSFNIAAGGGTAKGCAVLTQQGGLVQVTGTGTDNTGSTVVVQAIVLFSPPVGALPPYTTVNFNGVAHAAG
jgi:hypothetical protein